MSKEDGKQEVIKWMDKLPWLSDLNECLVSGLTLLHSSLFFCVLSLRQIPMSSALLLLNSPQ